MEFVYLLGFILLVIAVTVLPVMIAAKWARARRAGFGHALVAVVLATIVAQLALSFTGDPLIGLLLSFVAACAAYALVLGTSFVAAVGIAVVAVVLQVLIVTALLVLGVQVPPALPIAV